MRRSISARRSEARAAVAKLHFPGLHQDAATWLVEQRKVKAVGIDTASIDYGQSTGFEAHRVLCGRNIPVFENLTSLDELPFRGATVYRAADQDQGRERRAAARDRHVPGTARAETGQLMGNRVRADSHSASRSRSAGS